jgi:hypothetical protein
MILMLTSDLFLKRSIFLALGTRGREPVPFGVVDSPGNRCWAGARSSRCGHRFHRHCEGNRIGTPIFSRLENVRACLRSAIAGSHPEEPNSPQTTSPSSTCGSGKISLYAPYMAASTTGPRISKPSPKGIIAMKASTR